MPVRRFQSLGFLAIFALAGCATGAGSKEMALGAVPSAHFPEPLHGAMCVPKVTGGQATYLLGMSEIGNGNLRKALAESLAANGLLAAGDGFGMGSACRFVVSADILEVNQPFFGFDLKVTTHVHYSVGDPPPAAILLDRTVTAYGIARFRDSPIGVIRLRLANEAAMRASIAKFLKLLAELTVPPAAMPNS